MRWGIEFEYLLIDRDGAEPGRVRDFSNLAFAEIRDLVDQRPGVDDPRLRSGDLGIKRGYWYLEGDERFHTDGSFRQLEVKGIEIRTPPAGSVDAAVALLLNIEEQLTAQLAPHGLGLAIAAFNPVRPGYDFSPPLNPFEQELRRLEHAYDGSRVSTLSYGPDLNLSHPDWDAAQCLDVARKLNHYAPFLVPFSFHSPFAAGKVWEGPSKRTWERAQLRPAVKAFFDPVALPASRLAQAARLPSEIGRIEFKAFDAMPTAPLLAACGHLLAGVCAAPELTGRSEETEVCLYRRAAKRGFADDEIRAGATHLLACAGTALDRQGDEAGVAALGLIAAYLERRRTPADDLLDAWRADGRMYAPPLAAELATL
jgi:hypothetical protein